MSVRDTLSVDTDELEDRWDNLIRRLEQRFGREADIESALFLMGVHVVGRGYEPELPKERKQSLIMEGSYLAFETLGVYRRVGIESDGFLIWEKMEQLPTLSVEQQENLLRMGILNFFDDLPVIDD